MTSNRNEHTHTEPADRETEIKKRLYEIQEEQEKLNKEYAALFWELKSIQSSRTEHTHGNI
jgi:predicted  nucleic acid-binding Zn-ribbon protein